MRLRKTPTYFNFAMFIIVTLLVNLSCDKDSDLFLETVLDDDAVSVEELDATDTEALLDEADVDEIDSNQVDAIDLESRITVFPTVNDAYFQDGTGFNTQVNRLEEDSRISYLMFDLSQIESIGGVITAATLEFIIHEDTGNGIIDVYKGNSNDWSENNLTPDSAPSKDVLLGSIEKEYKLNERIQIDLDVQEIALEYATLILFHRGGNDLAFASQENNNFEGPKLKVVYETSIDADEIVIEDLQSIEEESTEEETTNDTSAEETVDEDSTEEEHSEEDAENDTSEETSDDEASSEEEETTTEEETQEESTEEETTNDTSEEETVDEEATNEEEETTSENPNIEPVAVLDATPKTGYAPLEVQFSGSQSTDDKGISTYEWNFNDGTTSSLSNPNHTFNEVGTYNVSLKVYDEEGKSSTADVLITVQERPNEAPVAVAKANRLEGDAPLEVNFRGSDSTDDKGIATYYWDFPFDPSAAPNNLRTFTVPGVYIISLTVTDREGLRSTAQLTITVNESETPPPLPIGCVTTGGKADETGFKSWCWQDINLPSGAPGDDNFSNSDLVISNECNPGQVTKEGNRLKFSLNPTSPEPQNWCSNNYNMRAEIRTAPWKVNHPIGTEEWFGWSYTFGDNYKIDKINPWIFFQIHEGTTGKTPMLALWCTSENGAGGVNAGEIIVSNTTGGQLYSTTGVRPQAGQTIDIVVRVIYGDDSNGLIQIWIDGNKVHDVNRRTVHRFNPVGGNAKFGIYKWPWRQASGVQSSAQQGINSLETYMGPLRIITRKPSDPDYKKDAYQDVAPR